MGTHSLFSKPEGGPNLNIPYLSGNRIIIKMNSLTKIIGKMLDCIEQYNESETMINSLRHRIKELECNQCNMVNMVCNFVQICICFDYMSSSKLNIKTMIYRKDLVMKV